VIGPAFVPVVSPPPLPAINDQHAELNRICCRNLLWMSTIHLWSECLPFERSLRLIRSLTRLKEPSPPLRQYVPKPPFKPPTPLPVMHPLPPHQPPLLKRPTPVPRPPLPKMEMPLLPFLELLSELLPLPLLLLSPPSPLLGMSSCLMVSGRSLMSVLPLLPFPPVLQKLSLRLRPDLLQVPLP